MECLQYYTVKDIELLEGLDVLNLVINGMPSIQGLIRNEMLKVNRFKPCYKWNAFNTRTTDASCSS